MLNISLETKLLKYLLIYLNPLSIFISLGIPMYEKHLKQWVIICSVASAVCIMAIKIPE